MTDSLFDDQSILFSILVNNEQQYSIWPQSLPIPAGWAPIQESIIQGAMSRQSCMEWLAQHWTDLRPQSLRSTEGQDS